MSKHTIAETVVRPDGPSREIGKAISLKRAFRRAIGTATLLGALTLSPLIYAVHSTSNQQSIKTTDIVLLAKDLKRPARNTDCNKYVILNENNYITCPPFAVGMAGNGLPFIFKSSVWINIANYTVKLPLSVGSYWNTIEVKEGEPTVFQIANDTATISLKSIKGDEAVIKITSRYTPIGLVRQLEDKYAEDIALVALIGFFIVLPLFATVGKALPPSTGP